MFSFSVYVYNGIYVYICMPRRFRRETISASGTITHTFSLSSNSLHFEQCLPVDHLCNIWQWESMLKIPTFCGAAFLMEDPTEVWLPSPRNSYLLQEQSRTIIVPWPYDQDPLLLGPSGSSFLRLGYSKLAGLQALLFIENQQRKQDLTSFVWITR